MPNLGWIQHFHMYLHEVMPLALCSCTLHLLLAFCVPYCEAMFCCMVRFIIVTVQAVGLPIALEVFPR